LREVFAANGRIEDRFLPSQPTGGFNCRRFESVFLSALRGRSLGYADAICDK
jgi:hypothetical protein